MSSNPRPHFPERDALGFYICYICGSSYPSLYWFRRGSGSGTVLCLRCLDKDGCHKDNPGEAFEVLFPRDGPRPPKSALATGSETLYELAAALLVVGFIALQVQNLPEHPKQLHWAWPWFCLGGSFLAVGYLAGKRSEASLWIAIFVYSSVVAFSLTIEALGGAKPSLTGLMVPLLLMLGLWSALAPRSSR